MHAVGRLVEDLTCAVGLLGGTLELKADFTFENVSDDETRMTVRPGVAACRIIYFGYRYVPMVERDWRQLVLEDSVRLRRLAFGASENAGAEYRHSCLEEPFNNVTSRYHGSKIGL